MPRGTEESTEGVGIEIPNKDNNTIKDTINNKLEPHNPQNQEVDFTTSCYEDTNALREQINALKKQIEILQNGKKSDKTNETEDLKLLKEHFDITWNEYPNKQGRAKSFEYFLQWIKGRNISGTTIKLTDKQMYFAVMNYKKECEDNKTEIKYIKHGDTFFNKAILDYVEEE